MTVYFFQGEEDFNIDAAITEMRSKLNPDFISMSYKTYDNPQYPDLISAISATPMMFGNSLTIINAEEYFFSKKNFFEDNELDEIKITLENNIETSDIIFVVRLSKFEGKKIDSRKKLFKILSKFNMKEFQVFKTYETAKISNWINERAKKLDIIMEQDATNTLIEHIGNNLQQFDCELNKLKLMAYPQKKITLDMVNAVSASNQDIFNLLDYILQKKKDKVLLEFQKLTDKKHPLEIIATIQTILKKWIILKTKNESCSAFELSKLTGQHEFVVKQTLQKLKNTKTADLVKLKQYLYDAEYKYKNLDNTDLISEVEIALIR